MIQRPVEPVVTEYLYGRASRTGVPLSGTFELTPVCNMNCNMCYIRMSKQEQEAVRPLHTAQEWIALAQKAKDAGMLYLLLTGGEPFMHPEFPHIMEQLHRMGFVISINTNGTMIDEQVVQWLKETPPVRMNITLYGACDETYKRLCGNPNGFTQVNRAIMLLRQAGIEVKINCSITPYNKEDIPKIVEYARHNSLQIQPAAYMFPPLRKDASMVGKNNRLSPEEAAYYTVYADYLLYGKEHFLNQISKMSFPSECEESCVEMGEGVRCRAGKCSFWITWDGKMLPCGMFSTSHAKNVFEDDFQEIWELVKQETAQIRLPVQCAGCSIKDQCHACAAMVYTESGCFEKVPRYRCEMMKSIPKQYKAIEREIKEH